MLSTIGLATARQLRLAGTRNASRLAAQLTRKTTAATPSIICSGSFVIPRRGFSSTRARLLAAAPTKTKTTTETTNAASATKAKKKPAKRAVKKPAAKKPKKTLTPEQKKKELLKELKKLTLADEEPPRRSLAESAWLVFCHESIKGATILNLATAIRERSVEFQTLSQSERDRLKDQADHNRILNAATYKSWVESKTPAEIQAANNVRLRLRRNGVKIKDIPDSRIPTRTKSAYNLYCKSRWQSGEFDGVPVGEAVKTIAAEWNALSAAQRQPFLDEYQQEKARFSRESAAVGITVKS